MNAILPTEDEMYAAVVASDTQFDGVFFVAVKSTGIFCRPGCTARTPLRKNVLYFKDAPDAIAAGFRACKRCRPMEIAGRMPDWLNAVMEFVDQQPEVRLKDFDLQKIGEWNPNEHVAGFKRTTELHFTPTCEVDVFPRLWHNSRSVMTH